MGSISLLASDVRRKQKVISAPGFSDEKLLLVFHFFLVCLKQSVTLHPRLALNSQQTSCLSLLDGTLSAYQQLLIFLHEI